MTTTAQLRDMVVDCLKGSTDAGAMVYSPRSWPTQDNQYPYLMVQVPEESMDSLGRNVPQFNTVATIRVMARVQKMGEANDQGAVKTEAELEKLKSQILTAVINSSPLTQSIQQFLAVHITMSVDSTGGTNMGALIVSFQLEFYQGPEEFYPVAATELETVDLGADLTNVVDPTGVYPDAPFPSSVTPAPRTVGPDGRAEGHVIVNPQG